MTLTVTKADLTVTPNNQSRPYNTANPVLTWTLTGFVNGDTASVVSGSPTLSTTATTTSPVGNYSITVMDAGSSCCQLRLPQWPTSSMAP